MGVARILNNKVKYYLINGKCKKCFWYWNRTGLGSWEVESCKQICDYPDNSLEAVKEDEANGRR